MLVILYACWFHCPSFIVSSQPYKFCTFYDSRKKLTLLSTKGEYHAQKTKKPAAKKGQV